MYLHLPNLHVQLSMQPCSFRFSVCPAGPALERWAGVVMGMVASLGGKGVAAGLGGKGVAVGARGTGAAVGAAAVVGLRGAASLRGVACPSLARAV